MQTLTLRIHDRLLISDCPLQSKAIILSQVILPSRQGLDGFVVDAVKAAMVLNEPGCCSISLQYKAYPTQRVVQPSMPMGQSTLLQRLSLPQRP